MNRMRYRVVLLAGLVCSLGPAWGEDAAKPPPSRPVTADDLDQDTSRPDAVKAEQLATQFSVPQPQVLDMRQTDKMGWGEIRNLLLISQSVSLSSEKTASPLTMDQAWQQVQAQRKSGMGIGQIANSYDLKLGELEKADRANEQANRERDHADKVDRPDKPEKVAKPEKPDKVARPDKPDRPGKIEKPDRPDRPAKPEKPDRLGNGK